MRKLKIGNRLLGDGEACFLVAEAGINHGGNVEVAHRLIDAASESGADAVKFQNYRTEDFLTDRSLRYAYAWGESIIEESQYEMFLRCELPGAALAELRRHCEERDVVFFSTPTSYETLAELVDSGAPLLKNGSDFIGHLPLIRAMAETGLPTVLSTGMATIEEIADAVGAFREAGGAGLVLLHCTSAYPTAPEDVHLKKIQSLRNTFECLVGFSDHSDGSVAALGAVALGACMVEKHFTLDRHEQGPDHRFSADPDGFLELSRAVRTLEKELGHGNLGPTDAEMAGRADYRLSCVAARALPEGHRLTRADIAFHRPGTGMPPKDVDDLIGKRLMHSVPSNHPFRRADLS